MTREKREYRKEHGSFYFYVNDRMQFMADEVGICFSIMDNDVVLHKHGVAADVVAWWKEHRDEYQGLFGDLHIAESGEWDPEELTRCLELPFRLIELMKGPVAQLVRAPGS